MPSGETRRTRRMVCAPSRRSRRQADCCKGVAIQPSEKYRRDLCYLAKKRLPGDHELRNFQVKHIPLDAFEVAEPQIYAACKQAAVRNDGVPPGELRMIKTKDPQNGLEMISFYGQESFVTDFKAPIRYVRGFRTDHGYWNTAGRYLHEKR